MRSFLRGLAVLAALVVSSELLAVDQLDRRPGAKSPDAIVVNVDENAGKAFVYQVEGLDPRLNKNAVQKLKKDALDRLSKEAGEKAAANKDNLIAEIDLKTLRTAPNNLEKAFSTEAGFCHFFRHGWNAGYYPYYYYAYPVYTYYYLPPISFSYTTCYTTCYTYSYGPTYYAGGWGWYYPAW